MRYLVRERLFSIKDDFWVTDADGNRAFFVDAKILSLHRALEFKDASGRPLATIKHRLLTFTDAMEIEHDGAVVATVHKAVFSPLHHRAHVDLAGGGRLEAVGDIIDKEFEVRDGDRVLALISRKWFRIRDTYGVDVAPGENDALMIAIAVCLDRIHAEEEAERR
ncbi:MAG TPA: LURP-one-related family protein [Streptosporangiaceae bacterium]|nr:LURP-one-related family protein [Streptosporangiaceae bacterium]